MGVLAPSCCIHQHGRMTFIRAGVSSVLLPAAGRDARLQVGCERGSPLLCFQENYNLMYTEGPALLGMIIHRHVLFAREAPLVSSRVLQRHLKWRQFSPSRYWNQTHVGICGTQGSFNLGTESRAFSTCWELIWRVWPGGVLSVPHKGQLHMFMLCLAWGMGLMCLFLNV